MPLQEKTSHIQQTYETATKQFNQHLKISDWIEILNVFS